MLAQVLRIVITGL